MERSSSSLSQTRVFQIDIHTRKLTNAWTLPWQLTPELFRLQNEATTLMDSYIEPAWWCFLGVACKISDTRGAQKLLLETSACRSSSRCKSTNSTIRPCGRKWTRNPKTSRPKIWSFERKWPKIWAKTRRDRRVLWRTDQECRHTWPHSVDGQKYPKTPKIH